MAEVTEAHEEKETLSVSVFIPGHDKREGVTPLFRKSKEDLVAREGGRCWVCNRTEAEAGHPLEAHHHPIERCFSEEIDWELFSADCKAGLWGPRAQDFDWVAFFEDATPVKVTVAYPADLLTGASETSETFTYLHPQDPYLFVDDMRVNGELLCKDHHTVADEGKHTLPYPIWVAQRYARRGVKFSEREVIHRGS